MRGLAKKLQDIGTTSEFLDAVEEVRGHVPSSGVRVRHRVAVV
jgi:hypothetical protein